MNESTENLVLQILKQIQADQTAMRKDINELQSEVRSLARALIHVEESLLLMRSDNIAIKDRLDRIERRLDLVD